MLLEDYLKEFKIIRNNEGIIAYEFKQRGSYKQDKIYYNLFHLCLTKLPYKIIDKHYYKFTDTNCIIWFSGLTITINNLKEVLK